VNTQGLILEEMRKKSEEEIRAREARIAAIRKELDNIRREGVSSPGSAGPDPRLRDLESELLSLQSDASSRLKELTDRRERQAFLIRQLQSLYRNLSGQIGAGRFGEAVGTIAAAERFLEGGSAGDAGDVAALAPALRPVNDLLRRLVGAEQAAADNAAAAGVAGTVNEISRLDGQADAAYAAGNITEAAAIYGRALDSLDAVSRAWVRLRDLTLKDHEAALGRLETETAALRTSLSSLRAEARRREAELAALKEAAGRSETESLGSREEKEVLEKRVAEREREIREKEETVRRITATVRSGMENLAVETKALAAELSPANPQVQVAELLDTKITLREIAGSEIVRAGHPEIYRNFDSFFERYAQLYARMGGEAAARDLIAKVNETLEFLRAALPENP
jgi:DNA repair exonuclease SbcCD ATPase subunit